MKYASIPGFIKISLPFFSIQKVSKRKGGRLSR